MQQAQGNLRGIALMVAAMALFGIEDMFLKWAAADLPIGQVVFVSGAFGAPVFALMAWRAGARILTRAALHPAVLARNAGEMIGTFAYITALATVPLPHLQALLERVGQTSRMALLSPREIQIVQLVVRGWSSIAIGERLSLSPKTVDTYRSRLMAKLDVNDLPSLVRLAIREGLIGLDEA